MSLRAILHESRFTKHIFFTYQQPNRYRRCRVLYISPSLSSSSFRYYHDNNNNNCNEDNQRLSNEIKQYLSAFPAVYSQKDCETFWSDVWHRSGLFRRNDETTETTRDDSFRLLLPPPNITGNLHLGHALTVSIQDSLCRFHRMNGRNVIWYGGADHAGIATQMTIEKMLWSKSGKTRHDVTRHEFAQIFDQWKVEKIAEIQRQLRAMGVSIDFAHDYFTMSPQMSRIVRDAFITLFNHGLIYRSTYMANWSYYLQSTLSDIEIEHRFISKPTEYRVPDCAESFTLGVLHQFAYPLDGADSAEFVTIATTRLESLMGDVALCVHPDDSRYTHLVGRNAYNPFTRRLMPIWADAAVKPDFGTGVLKLTPAHSTIDYEIMQRHVTNDNLADFVIDIFDDRGRIRCEYEPLNGAHRYAAKALVRAELERFGLYRGAHEHSHWLPICSRSGDIIETRPVAQWFLRCDDARHVAEYAINRDNLSDDSRNRWRELMRDEPRHRNVSLVPSSYRNTWKDWFSRFQDWCISRQIFWGHQIPAYRVHRNSLPTDIWIAATSEEEALKIAIERHRNGDDAISVQQDTDVLDTWFSSCLLPLSVSGWFDRDSESNAAHRHDSPPPLSLMETGHDIIFFWVARMVLLSYLLAGKLPFDRVLLHGMICDSNGKKMSKSKGNVVDPMHLIDGATLEDLIRQSKDYFESGLISDEALNELLRKTVAQLPDGIPVCGADVLRLSLLQADFKEQKVNFDLGKTIKKRVFANKMHQTIRFILLHLGENDDNRDRFDDPLDDVDQFRPIDRWIFTKFANLCNRCRESFASYDLHRAARDLETFWIHDLCDVYLETIKYDIIEKSDHHRQSLRLLIELTRQSLRLLHPFMPFISENLYQHLEFALNGGNDYRYRSILEQRYPAAAQDALLRQFDRSYMDDFEKVLAITRKIRSFRQCFFINREPLIEKVRVASLLANLPQYQSFIRSAISRKFDCEIEFVDLHDVFRFDDEDDCYCVRVDLAQDDHGDQTVRSAKNSDIETTKNVKPQNSLQYDEIYLLFSVNEAKLRQRLQERKLNLSEAKIANLIEQLKQLQSKRFSENYKKITKIPQQ